MLIKYNNLKKIILVCSILVFFVIFELAGANINNHQNPKIANYFLSWSLSDQSVQELAQWDFLILDMENQVNNPDKIREIRELNPNVLILAYIPIEEIAYDSINCECTQLRKRIAEYIPESWYLHNDQGERLGFWSNSQVVNVTDQTPFKNGQRWNTFLPRFVQTEILSTGLWDGVFYDNTSASISWVDPGKIDINNDGQIDSDIYIDSEWKKGTKKILRITRENNPDYIIIGNSASDIDFQEYLNGRMFETFPTPWEGNGSWEYVSDLYLNEFPQVSLDPRVYVVNSNTENTGIMDNYRKMRFGLTSTLLGEGYYSFDFGDQSHTQTWWYDEYSYFLGQPQSEPYNLLDEDGQDIKPGLWRRDFDRGIVIVNSTNQEQTHVFLGEDLEKINGSQDRRINNGSKINWIKLNPRDGVVLLKTNKDIVNDGYLNGGFVRVFNKDGEQERNGFFSFQEGYEGNVEILKTDLDNDGELEVLVNGLGKISIYRKNGVESFYPYGEHFISNISFAVGDLDNDGYQEIITGAGVGGGPHVRVFNKDGELINPGWFAYNPRFYGGISVAVGDLDNDGYQEIITGAGVGGGPHVRVFNKDGELINQFFAYESNFYGGISVAVGNVNNSDEKEIIVSPGKGGQSQIKIFSQYGDLLGDFRAYDYQQEINTRIIANDIDSDGRDEILVSVNDF